MEVKRERQPYHSGSNYYREGGRSETKMLNCKRRDAGLVRSPVLGM